MKVSSAVPAAQIDLLPAGEGEQIQAYLTALTDKDTVPYVFIGGSFIGGECEGLGFFWACQPSTFAHTHAVQLKLRAHCTFGKVSMEALSCKEALQMASYCVQGGLVFQLATCTHVHACRATPALVAVVQLNAQVLKVLAAAV